MSHAHLALAVAAPDGAHRHGSTVTDGDHLDAGRRGVTLLSWPDEADRRHALAAVGRPRLLLLDPGVAPPTTWDDLEDWVRLPAEPEELAARVENLVRRSGAGPDAPAPDLGGVVTVDPAADPAATTAVVRPLLDADGILRSADGWVAVPPIEARLLALLLGEPGAVVTRDDLVAAGWPQGTADAHILDGRIKLLRRRVGTLGLEIHTVRGVGFLLQPPAES